MGQRRKNRAKQPGVVVLPASPRGSSIRIHHRLRTEWKTNNPTQTQQTHPSRLKAFNTVERTTSPQSTTPSSALAGAIRQYGDHGQRMGACRQAVGVPQCAAGRQRLDASASVLSPRITRTTRAAPPDPARRRLFWSSHGSVGGRRCS